MAIPYFTKMFRKFHEIKEIWVMRWDKRSKFFYVDPPLINNLKISLIVRSTYTTRPRLKQEYFSAPKSLTAIIPMMKKVPLYMCNVT